MLYFNITDHSCLLYSLNFGNQYTMFTQISNILISMLLEQILGQVIFAKFINVAIVRII